jgi:hypothetical protein
VTASASSSVVPSSTRPGSLSIAQRCDQDSLSVIFSFCEGLPVMAVAARTCRLWYVAAGRRQSSCHGGKRIPGLEWDAILQVLQSPLRIHLSVLRIGHGNRMSTGADLLQLFAGCPQLEELIVSMDAHSIDTLTESPDGTAPFSAHAWPSALRRVQFDLYGYDVDLQPLVAVLPPSSDSGLPTIDFVLIEDAWMDLTPLIPLSQRTSLCVYNEMPDSSLAAVKQMRGLVDLSLSQRWPGVSDILKLLTEGPHQLQRLETISMNHHMTFNVQAMQALQTLPNLTAMEPSSIHPSCFPLLSSFVKMRTLCVVPEPSVDEAAVRALLSSLRALTELRSFEISGDQMTPELQATLLDGLAGVAPQLRELTLSAFASLPSLHALRGCAKLRKLEMSGCGLAAAAASDGSHSIDDVLQLLQSLHHLEWLEFDYCDLPLTDAQRAQLTPPSVLVPSLRHFGGRNDA